MKHYDLLDGVKSFPANVGDDTPHYNLRDIKAIPGVKVTEPLPECYLAVRVSECGTFVTYAAFKWVSEGDDDDDVELEAIFHGHGTGGVLREMRHTYFGPDRDGYCFYLPIDKTIALLNALKVYFDD